MWGDARVIGGKKSTIITLSPIDHHFVLREDRVRKLHSPAMAMTLAIYDGDDHRLTMKENIKGWLNRFVEQASGAFYLTGDCMFLNAMEGGFGPMKKNGKCLSQI